MGNPCRYFLNNEILVLRPVFAKHESLVKIVSVSGKLKDHYDDAVIDFYSAPDVILTYTNGNTCKDEWRRYSRWEFKGLKLADQQDLFSFDEVTHSSDDSICEIDIPIGKFSGMSREQIEKYKSENFLRFRETSKRL